MIKGILFDLDGTLVNTNDLIIKSFKYTFNKALGVKVENEEILSFFGEPLHTTMERYGKNRAEEITNIYKEYNWKVHDLYAKKIDGALEGIKLFKVAGYKIGIVTSKRRRMALKGLRFADLLDYVDKIITPEDTEKHKPDPEPIIKICKILNLSTKEVIMVGDSSYDILCAKNAGAKSALVSYTILNKDKLLDLKPDFYINSIVDLYNGVN